MERLFVHSWIEITIVADAELVDPDNRPKIVSHDFNDFAVGKRHNLEMINILNLDGSLNKEGKQKIVLDRFDARKGPVEKY